ncbi:DNRLRE domain-containing protein [Clostridium sp. AL.422]|uniref:DNRLRE domain-containing protein n=1 Tax=Clostridium TaxID=1485 RepID=UPI00293DF0D4|nr:MULTISPECIES: DNRLRE domain-containing protein [unclassified Clostridium]MDV4150904.1 DNRLRE domain-containing protein [Clostridium sp. AL.422]
MSNIIIPAVKSLTVTNKYPNKSINEGTITIGFDNKNTYYSYLFFDFSSLASDIIIYSAELVLFKTDQFFNNIEQKILISPLRDYFSTYTTYNNVPNYDHYSVISFYPLTSKVAVTINVTNMVSAWIKNRPSNKGIILYGKSKGTIVNFGSVKNNDTYLIPFIKVHYDHIAPNRYNKKVCRYENAKNYDEECIKICKGELEEICTKICKNICCNNPYPPPTPPVPNPGTIVDVDVTGNVAPYSVYNIIIEVEVIRASTGQKDYYYVSDVYNNSLNDDSLLINKTYKIAVVPEIQSGDTKSVRLYGSYTGPVIHS